MKSVEVLGDKQIRVGKRTLRLGRVDQPFPDGTWLVVEVSARPYSEHQQKFVIGELDGVLAGDMPDGLDFSIDSPQLGTKEAIWLNIVKVGGLITLKILLQHSFASWSGRSNLIHFSHALASSIEDSVGGCEGVTVTHDEYGTNLSCAFLLRDQDDLRSLILKKDRELTVALRDAMLRDAKWPGKAMASDLKPDEAGAKWWLRYAIVPLLAVVVAATLKLLF